MRRLVTNAQEEERRLIASKSLLQALAVVFLCRRSGPSRQATLDWHEPMMSSCLHDECGEIPSENGHRSTRIARSEHEVLTNVREERRM